LLNLSYYQIDDYLTCPLKYKYVNILRVPIMEHHTVIYGRAMHEAVTKYFQYKIAGKKMGAQELIDAFAGSFDPQGFLDEKHQKERFSVGTKALYNFFAREEKEEILPTYIEKDFSFILEGNKINGRFDRVDLLESGAVILDFKTSEIKIQREADKRAKESLQLSLYALAFKNIFGVLPQSLKLYFLESGIIGSRNTEEKDLEKVRDRIIEVSSGVRKGEFNATPSFIACAYCAYNQICSHAQKG
ncbi:MAG: PD-(D/E)XK nuclease family protein, partial [Candidatus Firestonebacteria bacterium]